MSSAGGRKLSTARVRRHRLLNKIRSKRPRLSSTSGESSSSPEKRLQYSSECDSGTDADDESSITSQDQNAIGMDRDLLDNTSHSDHERLNDPSDNNYFVQNGSDETSDSSNVHNLSLRSNSGASSVDSIQNSRVFSNEGTDNSVSYDENDGDDRSMSGTSSDSTTNDQLPEDYEIHELKQWSVSARIPNIHLDTLLKILRQRLLPQLPKNSKTFLGTTKAKYNIRIMTDSRNEAGEYVYMGVAEGLKACLNVNAHPTREIKLDFNIDGVKIHKNSQMTMWPILCKIYSSPDIYKPFPVCIFYGNGKPKNFGEYFVDFILEMNHLMEYGLEIQQTLFVIQIRCFTCDKPATDAIKAVRGHTSFDGCGRCKVKGEKVDNVTVFLHLNCEKRTAEGFRNFEDVNHHNGHSPLLALDPPIDFVYMFILEPMHAIHLGVTPRLLSFLMKGAQNSPVIRLSAQQKTELNRRTKMIKKDIPHEFKRKMPSTDFFEDYHAVDNRFFLLYCGPIVFKKILNDDYYENFLLLHLLIRMLSSPQAAHYTNLARHFSHQFIEEAKLLYGSTFVTINVHSLSHIADDVDNMECSLDEMSAFPYENELGKIKNILLSPHRTVAQYCRRIHVQRSMLMIPPLLSELKIIKQTVTGKILEVNFKNYFLSAKHPNNTALLDNRRPVKIHKFSLIDEEIRDELEMYVGIYKVASKMVKFNLNFSDSEQERIFLMPLIH
ncbi:hypothetical protein QAD02_012850 [Eretmocerus hayati]|uniref:Uncharacterized protein n=1 Tax=Eretmocerus hayati TaxID=131215 RepID=A0ACC2P0S8_9HYME|nr:hypothetical protein QAD02_012850 [Eretmocerus hayati]